MAVKIRLTRLGSKRNPFYRIVVADARSPRDGRIIEQLGTYNPGDGIAEILGHDNYAKGIKVREDNGIIDVDMYIIVSYGVKISEVASNLQSTVKYTLEKTLNVKVNSINIFVQGVRVNETVKKV